MTPETPTASRLIGALIIDEDALRTAVKILVLAAAQRPQEGNEAGRTEKKRHRDEDDEIAHCTGLSISLAGTATRGSSSATERPPASRMALAMTMIDDSDMAIAAISGVT